MEVSRRSIEGYEGRYSVTCDGRVWSHPKKTNGKGLYLKTASNRGYRTVSLVDANGRVKTASVHRLVANAFLSKVKGKHFVNHLNGKKDDNSVENLEWCTSSENELHAHRTGLHPPTIGEANGMSKLTADDVKTIRKMFKLGFSNIVIASEYGVNRSLISMIRNGKRWSRVS